MKTLFKITILALSFSSFAQEIFVIKKNINPKNVLHFEAVVKNCNLVTPYVANYWIMGEKDGHREGLSGQEKPYFRPNVTYQNDKEADFSIGAMNNLGNKLENKSVRVRLENCVPKAYLEINKQEIKLTDLYVEVGFLMAPKYMVINGIAPDGSKFSRRIDN